MLHNKGKCGKLIIFVKVRVCITVTYFNFAFVELINWFTKDKTHRFSQAE